MSRFSSRGLSRIGAVQAIYQFLQIHTPLKDLLNQFITYHFKEDPFSSRIGVNVALFEKIVTGVVSNNKDFNETIMELIKNTKDFQNIPSVSLSIMQCALFELTNSAETHSKIIINEYVNIASCFFCSNGVKFVNGVLNKMARELRTKEFT